MNRSFARIASRTLILAALFATPLPHILAQEEDASPNETPEQDAGDSNFFEESDSGTVRDTGPTPSNSSGTTDSSGSENSSEAAGATNAPEKTQAQRPARLPTPIGTPPPALLERSRELDLASKRYWHLLGHYERNSITSGYTSRADNLDFFLSKDGRNNPQSELEATIAAFYAPVPEEDPNAHAVCRYPARFAWISQQMQLDHSALPKPRCVELGQYMNLMRYESVSLIFASYYMSAPASMFGHTLLKVNAPGKEGGRALLDFAINYGANPGDLDPLRYALYGLSGGYQGNFSILPYHIKVREYNDVEARDMWEYELNFEQHEVQRMLLHVWEMDNARFDYFYMDENCSFYLLALLEIARPELRLRENSRIVILPGETVKTVVRQKGLLRDIRYRPSLRSEVQQRLMRFTDEEREIFFAVFSGELGVEDESFGSFFNPQPQHAKARFLDTMLSAVRYDSEGEDETDPQKRKLFRQLIQLRRQVPPVDDPWQYEPRSEPPHFSHDVYMLKPGGGASSEGGFAELQLRPVFHDILNREEGLAPLSEFRWLDFRVRHYADAGKTLLHDFKLLRLIALSPYEPIDRSLSYYVDMGAESQFLDERTDFLGVDLSFLADLDPNDNDSRLTGVNTAYFDGMTGYAFQNLYDPDHWTSGFTVTALAGARIEGVRGYDTILAPQAELGLLYDTRRWRFSATLRGIYSGVGPRDGFEARPSLGVRYSFSQDSELRLETASRKNFSEATLSYVRMF